MAQEVNILHLSDFHYSNSSSTYNRTIVSDALLKDIENLCVNFLSIDIVLFSGDLVKSDDEKTSITISMTIFKKIFQ